MELEYEKGLRLSCLKRSEASSCNDLGCELLVCVCKSWDVSKFCVDIAFECEFSSIWEKM